MDRVRPRGERKRIEILRAAAGVFRRRGYHGASVDQIASALNMAPGNLSYDFRNKEEILYVCHDYSLGLMLEELSEAERAAARPADSPAHRGVRAPVHRRPARHGLDARGGSAVAAAAEESHRQTRSDRQGVQAHTDRRHTHRSLHAARSQTDAFVIFGAINWIPRWYDPAGRATSHEIAQTFGDYLVAGLQKTNRLTLAAAGGGRAPRRA